MSQNIGYYECRLTNLVIGRMDAVLSKRYLPGGPLIKIHDLKRMNEGMMFEVKSQSDGCLSHTVEMSVAVGFNGAPCKHQYEALWHPYA